MVKLGATWLRQRRSVSSSDAKPGPFIIGGKCARTQVTVTSFPTPVRIHYDWKTDAMAGSSPLQQAHAWLASCQSQMVADLIELANQNSWSSNFQGLCDVADWLVPWANLPTARFSRIPLPPRHWINEQGQEQAMESAPALVWEARAESDRRVLLGIHYDTVYGLDHPQPRCVPVTTERLLGPGVADAKGGLVVVRYALAALERFGLAENCGWTLLLNPDEEIGSPSSGPLWSRLAAEHDFGLLFEPAMPSGALVGVRKGTGSWTIVVRGKAAHAGRDFAAGRNAVALASRLAVQLDELNGQRDGTTINIGQIGGGGPVNVVPDLGLVRFNVRVSDPESQAWFGSRLADILAEADRREGFVVEVFGGFSAPPKMLDMPQRELMNAVELSAAALGQAVHWQASGGASDGNRLSACGLPNVDTLGPVGAGIHSPEEWVDVTTLPLKAQLVVELVAGFSTGRFAALARRHPGGSLS
jgi:glutamate carboxypeptidase